MATRTSYGRTGGISARSVVGTQVTLIQKERTLCIRSSARGASHIFEQRRGCGLAPFVQQIMATTTFCSRTTHTFARDPYTTIRGSHQWTARCGLQTSIAGFYGIRVEFWTVDVTQAMTLLLGQRKRHSWEDDDKSVIGRDCNA